MKDIYELLNDIDMDENEFEEMEVSEIEKARIKKSLKKSIHRKNNRYKKAIRIASCGVLCLGILSTTFSSYANEAYLVQVISKTIDTIRGYFETNDYGQTYGTYIDKGDGDLQEPDLIAVVGLNNVEGYVKKSDLYNEENQPENPDEAQIYMEEIETEGSRTIPIYKKDGKTVIGEYKID